MREKRDEILILRITKTEKNRIYEKMYGIGIRSLSAYIRKMALDGYCLNLDLPQLRRMSYLLQNCSNNLNQVAKRVNAQKEVEEYILAEMAATDTLEKKDIRKKAAEAKKKMDKLQNDLPKRRKEIQDEAQAEIDRFNQSQEINPLLLINIVLKF